MIALLVIFGVFGLAFIDIEIWQGGMRCYPPECNFTQRPVSYGSFYRFCTSRAIFVLTFYLPG